MFRLPALLAAALVFAAPAYAHKGSPNYLTRVDAITPADAGVDVEVLNRDDRLLLRAPRGEEIVIEGYNDDPYARIAPDGSVSVNTRSPAYYLNNDRYGESPIPKGVDGSGPPRWKLLDRTGRFEWHDHRMHWMAKSRLPQVTDAAVRTKIFDWKVPLTVGGRRGDIAGTLFWTPRPGASTTFLVVASAVFLLVCAAVLVLVRRRRARADAGVAEAW